MTKEIIPAARDTPSRPFLCVYEDDETPRCPLQCGECFDIEKRERFGQPPRERATPSPYDCGNPTKDYPGE